MENTFMLIIMIIAIIIIVAGILWYKHKKDNPKQTKQTGQKSSFKNTLRVLKRFCLDYNYKVDYPALISFKNKEIDLDALVVGYFGVLGILSLGYNGEIYGNKNDQNWLQVAPDGSRNYFKNPFTQADEAVRIIRQTLFDKGIKQVPVEVLVVFSSTKASIAIPKNIGYFTPKTLSKHLSKEKYGQDKGFDLEAVKKAIHAHILTK